VLEVADESDAVPLVLLPHLVLMLRRRGQAVRAWRPPLSNLGEGPGDLTSALSSASPLTFFTIVWRCRPGRRVQPRKS
jgi:hypothetical protein